MLFFYCQFLFLTLIFRLRLYTDGKQNIIIIIKKKMEVNDSNKNIIKIRPFQTYTKIQENKPSHFDNLVNKELGYDTIIELNGQENPIKIKQCTCSARSNSQLFKRFSKGFINNIKNQIDQIFLFTSNNAPSRLQTSIGTKSNPGIFIIVGLTYLDEKYKEAHNRCDVQFSFLQFREGFMYDLLCYTQKPLKPHFSTSTQQFVNFNQTWTKASTFNQFIKLLKIAVFNNKQRDFKSESKKSSETKLKSTLIMKIRSKIYSSQGILLKQQETILIDYQSNSFKENININIKQKINNKCTLDYFLIQINNCNPNNKPFYYHLVEENHLFLLIKKYLPKTIVNYAQNDSKTVNKEVYAVAQITFIVSIPSYKETFLQNYIYQQNIINHYNETWEIKTKKIIKFSQNFNFQHIQNQLKSISQHICLNTYPSLRIYNTFKHQIISQIKKYKNNLKQLRKLILQYLNQKIENTFLVNQLVADQFKLIGNCIKSDHFKDFYNSKSYLQLEREIFIKTQAIKEEILGKEKDIQAVEKKFLEIKKKDDEIMNKYNTNIKQHKNDNRNEVAHSKKHTPFNSQNQTRQHFHSSSEPKFKLLNIKKQTNPKDQLVTIIQQLYRYIYILWDKITLSNERNIEEYIILQQSIVKEEQTLKEVIEKFIGDVQDIQETDIMYEQENNQYNSNEIQLFRSLNFLGIMTNKHNIKGYDIGKRMIIHTDKKVLKQNCKISLKKDYKLPRIGQSLVIRGEIKMSQLLCNPRDFDNQSQKILENDSIC